MPTSRPRGPAVPTAVAAVAAVATALVVLLAGSPSVAAPGATAAVPVDRAAEPGPTPTPTSTPTSGADGDALGRWQVTDLGDGRYDVSWTSPTDLPLTSDRPTIGGAGLVFGPPTVGVDRRTVQAVVTAAEAPDPADLDVVLSGDRLDERGLDGPTTGPTTGPGSPVLVPRTTVLPDDPGLPGPFATVTSDYELDPVRLPRMREPIEMVGHVVGPVADAPTGPRPLVLLMHGRHSVCYDPTDPVAYTDAWPCAAPFEEIPSHLGYDYLQQVLASQGFTTVSVRVNGINAQDFRLDDGGAGARAAIVQRHLDHWVDLAADPGGPAGGVDLDRVVLVGHSRGGEGVDRASIRIGEDDPYRVAGQVLLAPTDFGAQSAPYVPTVTVLPYCDGDVSDIQGQQFTDNGRDLVTDDTSLKSSVLVLGANHNFFNTEWTPATAVAPAGDDWFGDKDAPCGRRHPGRLSAAEQRAVGTAYVAGAVALFTSDGPSDAFLPLYDGSAVTVGSVGAADVRTHALGGGRSLRRPGIEATPTLATGGAETRLCRGIATFRGGPLGTCAPTARDAITPHWAFPGSPVPVRQFFELAWTQTGAAGGLRFDDPLDLSVDRLELRTIVDPRSGPVDVAVRLTDGSGATATTSPDNRTEAGATLAPLLVERGLTKLWAQTLLVDAAGAGASDLAGLDLTDVVAVELVAVGERGRVWVADLAAAPAALAATPDVRLPRVRIGDLRVPEGDRPATRTVRLPFEVDGTVTRPARFVVQTTGQARGERQRFAVDLAPGQTSGSIPVTVTANTVADYQSRTEVVAYPVTGVMTDDYLGRLTVLDDDPEPVLRVRPVSRRVVEGEPIVLRASLSAPAAYDVSVYGEVVAGRGSDLRGTDVPLAWLEDRGASTDDPSLPLHRLFVGVFEQVPPGDRQVELFIPTSRDRRAEGSETLTLRFRVPGQRFRTTVTVLDAR